MSFHIYHSRRFQPSGTINKKPSLRYPRLKPWAIVTLVPKFVKSFESALFLKSNLLQLSVINKSQPKAITEGLVTK
jgi:hypothetical protein